LGQHTAAFVFVPAGALPYCRVPISWRYFGVELLTGALWVTLFWRLSGDTDISWANYRRFRLVRVRSRRAHLY
jgi:prepilin signal peptidase PulO-like enzyme (type II secretory pathway)